ncbi:MAG: type II toxin-antitoxin system RelE/ParE family toxin [Candidatus Acidiferrales bacterium]
MTGDQGFELHPGAAQDITEIWEFIAEDDPLAAGRLRQGILSGNTLDTQVHVFDEGQIMPSPMRPL